MTEAKKPIVCDYLLAPQSPVDVWWASRQTTIVQWIKQPPPDNTNTSTPYVVAAGEHKETNSDRDRLRVGTQRLQLQSVWDLLREHASTRCSRRWPTTPRRLPPQIRTHAYPSAGSTGTLIQTTEQRKLNTGARHPEPDPIARAASGPPPLESRAPSPLDHRGTSTPPPAPLTQSNPRAPVSGCEEGEAYG